MTTAVFNSGMINAEAATLIRLTDARDEVAEADRMLDQYLLQHPARLALRDQSAEADARLTALQRALIRPRPFHFLIRPAEA